MRIRIFTVAAVVISALATGTAVADTNFNGEVLIAPAPANWSGGIPETANNAFRQVWKRDFLIQDGVREQITVSRHDKDDTMTATDLALTVATAITEICVKKTISKITDEVQNIGVLASFTAQCDGLKDSPKANNLFAEAKIYVGEFNTYIVKRTWIGNKADPTSPANSPQTSQQWMAYFSRISVCNTLQSACNSAEAEIVHAHPRFKVMRTVSASTRPVILQENALKAARELGALTGQAAMCGEDVTPLTSKIALMFARIAANDRDSTTAVAAFRTAKNIATKAQIKEKDRTCERILQKFREHPSRIDAFYRYVEGFI